MITNLEQLWLALIHNEDRLGGCRWTATEDYANCIDPNTGQVLASIWHDGYGKYHPTIFVSIPIACKVFRDVSVISISFLGFPCVAIELIRIKAISMRVAASILHNKLEAWGAI